MDTQQSQYLLEKVKADLARSQSRLQEIQRDLDSGHQHSDVPAQSKATNISFFMPAYNCEQTIEESVHSIINGNFQVGDELIIVNDCSTDNTENVIESLRQNFPLIKYFKHTTNKGGAAARNTAIQNTSHDILFCLDSDNILIPGSIEKLKAFMLSSGADVAVFQELHFFIGEKENVIHKWVYKDRITLADFFKGDSVPGASGNYMFTKESWVRAGGYPESAVCLDTHGFGFKQLATGAKMLTCQGLYYYHRQGIESYYVRGSKTHNLSEIMAQIISPFTYLIEEADRNYIFGEGKYTWYENLQQRPIFLQAVGIEVKPEQLKQSSQPISSQSSQGAVESSGETGIIQRFISKGYVVFDVGANVGDWTKEVLNVCTDIELHLFEPIPHVYKTLLQSLPNINSRKIKANNLAITLNEGYQTFYYYEDAPAWSGFYRRDTAEKQGWAKAPKEIKIPTATLDNYCHRLGINRINFLKIDVEGGELDVLYGANNLLRRGQIDYIQFEYGGTYVDAKITLKQVVDYLHQFRYSIFKILPQGLEYQPTFLPQHENYAYTNFLAVNERFRSFVLGEPPERMLDLQQLCKQHSVTARGVIHIGAYEGAEIKCYQEMSAQKVLFVEANPAVFERLQANLAGIPNVLAVNCAVSNQNGTVNLRVTSMDQSSSILPLNHHLEIYPHIKETHQITIDSKTLDTLVYELQMQRSDFNILNIDIQGAELLALQGAANLLQYIEAINTEVNYEELYEGCALIDQIDEFLETHGFERTATTTPFHSSWGDAFYVKKPTITMSKLGSNGRFANQIFQYAFLKIYAKKHGLSVQSSNWIGQYLFGHSDSPIYRTLPEVRDSYSNIYSLAEALLPNSSPPYKNVDFWGYFQYNTKYYAPHKEYFRALFKPVSAVESQVQKSLNLLRCKGKTIVGLHLRRGDYGYEDFFIAPSEWYKEWLKGFWATLKEPILFIASDEPEKVLGDFAEYSPITYKDLGVELPQAPFYPDFYLLSHCDIVAISNSSFSFAACLLNDKATIFVRPHLAEAKLISFDPWNSEPLLRSNKTSSDVVSHIQAVQPDDSSIENSIPEKLANSSLSRLIPGEIKHDEFYKAIQRLAQTENLKTVLEIGSSSGEGSTEAFVNGLRANPYQPKLYCMEVSKPRFAALQKCYASDTFVKCYNVSSVSVEKFPAENEVREFYNSCKTILNNYPLEQILGWLQQDINYVKNAGVPIDGIKIIKQENKIEFFDLVLIDGSEFTGSAELDDVYGAKFIALDDTNAFKNYKSRQRLLGDSNYTLIADNQSLRNGYSIFKKFYPPTVQTDDSGEPWKKTFLFKGKNLSYNRIRNNNPPSERTVEVPIAFDFLSNLTNQNSILEVGNVLSNYQQFLVEQSAEIKQWKIIDKFEIAAGVDNQDLMDMPSTEKYNAIVAVSTVEHIGQGVNPSKSYGEDIEKKSQEAPLKAIAKIYDLLSIDGKALITVPFGKFTDRGWFLQFGREYLDGLVEKYEIPRKALSVTCLKLIAKEIAVDYPRVIWLQTDVEDMSDVELEYPFSGVNGIAVIELSKLSSDFPIHDSSSILNKVDSDNIFQDLALPINFFTIVLNGEPFIRYHIEVFKQLPFKWHWHIVEGVAELKHDTAWSLASGGHITDDLHRNGRSNDRTTEYLDELKRLYPENITIYRKPEGLFWDGKREMVNAPLANVREECLLWQVDVDELWTVEQICTARQIFLNSPDRTAAWYWCWYFVGKNLVISTRNCYAQNPQQDWLRTWRFKPGMTWQTHEPPRLVEPLPNGEWQDVASLNPFLHNETEKQGLVFQHFAYVSIKQLQFKEKYYGYQNAVSQWLGLQQETQLPALLRKHLAWVHDDTMVDRADACGVVSIQLENYNNSELCINPKIIVDGVFFQLDNTGIARVWNSILEEWVSSGFSKQVLLLDRAGTAPKIAGILYRTIQAYNYGDTDTDRQMLQQICDEEGADIFISTYYTTPISTPSVFMGYDMIPEVIGKNLDNPMWTAKNYGIRHASAYITISENTAHNLVGCFPKISSHTITVAHCGVSKKISPGSSPEISNFQLKYGISKPYFLLVGERVGWCGYKNGILFFKAFYKLPNRCDFDIVCLGGVPTIEAEFLDYTSGCQVHKLYLSDEELNLAYSGAVALIYPSLYEGFGMPVIEAMACGCPVITTRRASIPEVGGSAASYISGFDVNELVNALQEIQKPELRNQLISAGLEQAKKFSWSKMAEIVRKALLKATNKSSNDSSIITNKLIPKLMSSFNITIGKSLPKISIVTPSFNYAEYLEECIDSVLSQGYPNLEYVIMDGGSTDGSIDIIKKYEKHLNYWQSQPDGGQYASINHGFAKTNGEIMAWINADDKYHSDAFFKVAAAFNKYPEIAWLMGRPNAWDGLNGNAQFIAEYEPQWSREFLLGKTWKSCGQWIQQESTFWKRSLWNKAGGQLQLEPPMVTADFELWVRFSRYAQLYFIDTLLGGARWHEKQRSRVFWDRCMEEIDEVLAKEQTIIASGLHQTSLPAVPPVVLSAEEIIALKQQAKHIIQVSAIVSTYNSAKFIRGCLENLVNQTLYQKGELEIVVIDSASQQNEESIVKDFQAKYPNIIYERTSERETLYASWNRAIKMARGVYITNANTDDILRPDALEIMANYLDNHLEVSLIYPDQLITNTPNDTWETNKADRRWNWPPFDYSELETRCIIGSQPMWRKSLHEKYGYFRPEFTSAGDYEFWLRVGKTENLARIPEPLGLYYENPQGLEHSSSVGQQETQKILEEYGITQRGVIPKTSIPVAISPSELNALPYRKIGQSTVNTGSPLVSVIIPTKDRPEMLTQAIQSVLNQTFTELEIIVVNDGGVDVQSVISRLNAKGKIVYKKHDRALDRSAARNTGIRAARGKYIAYLDDDDIYYPNHIETLVKFLEKGEYKIAYTDAVMAQQEKQNGEYVTLHRSVPYSLDFDNDKILVSNCTPNLCLMHEKSCLDEVGLFDETLSTHEDWDLIIRLSRKFEIAHIKETTCEFTQRNDGTNTSSHNRGDFTRTREIIFNKYYQYAEANPTILAAQKDAFIAEAKELAQQVQHLQSEVTQKESHLQQTQTEKSHLAAQVETWQRSTQELQAKLEATQSEKEGVKSQLNSWKQTAEEMQIELERSRSKMKQAQSQLERSALNLIK